MDVEGDVCEDGKDEAPVWTMGDSVGTRVVLSQHGHGFCKGHLRPRGTPVHSGGGVLTRVSFRSLHKRRGVPVLFRPPYPSGPPNRGSRNRGPDMFHERTRFTRGVLPGVYTSKGVGTRPPPLADIPELETLV